MRWQSSIVALVLALSGGGSAVRRLAGSLVSNQRIVYSDGLHSENTEMIRLGDRILLIFAAARGQIGSARARIKVFESTRPREDVHPAQRGQREQPPRRARHPRSQAGRDERHVVPLRDQPPARLPLPRSRRRGVDRPRRVDRWRAHLDAPVKTYADVDAPGVETFWGFWRYTKRKYSEAGKRRQTLFATGYTGRRHRGRLVRLRRRHHWEKRSTIIDSYDDVPSEAELQFFGDNQENAVALVRLDNQDILADGQTAICTSHDPFISWECGRRIEQRLDGPTWIVRRARRRQRATSSSPASTCRARSSAPRSTSCAAT